MRKPQSLWQMHIPVFLSVPSPGFAGRGNVFYLFGRDGWPSRPFWFGRLSEATLPFRADTSATCPYHFSRPRRQKEGFIALFGCFCPKLVCKNHFPAPENDFSVCRNDSGACRIGSTVSRNESGACRNDSGVWSKAVTAQWNESGTRWNEPAAW